MTATAQTQAPSMFSVFRKPAFRNLWLAQLISTIGTALTSLAAGILIYQETGSALQVGLMLMATIAPGLFIGLFAGVFVDRMDRKKIMIGSDILRGIFILALPFVVENFGVGWLYVIMMISSAVSTFFDPAFDSVLPEVASDEELAAANSMIAISSFGSTAVGFAASGFLASVDINIAFYLDGVSFILSSGLIAMTTFPKLDVVGETNIRTIVVNLKAGMVYIYKSAVLRSLILLAIPLSLGIGLWNALLLPFSVDALGTTEFEYGLQEGLTSIGFVIGSLVVGKYSERISIGAWFCGSLILQGVLGMIYSQAQSIPFAIILIGISGFMNAPNSIARRMLMQRNTEREVRGRVFSSYRVVSNAVMVVGLLGAGLVDFIDIRLLFLLASAISVVAGFVAIFMPGIGRVTPEYLRTTEMLRVADTASGISDGRVVTLSDLEHFGYRFPGMLRLTAEERDALMKDMRYIEAEPGAVIVRHGESNDAAYFILEGRAAAGRSENGSEKILEILNSGDFFGEIAALTGLPRTANVVVEEPSKLLRVSADALKEMAKHPELNRMFYSKMMERMVRMNMLDSPRTAGFDQRELRELRTVKPDDAS